MKTTITKICRGCRKEFNINTEDWLFYPGQYRSYCTRECKISFFSKYTPPENKVFIYLLIDCDKPFYVGSTLNSLKRYNAHVSGSSSQKMYLSFPKKFLFKCIDTVDIGERYFWESHYIWLYRSWGFKLLNTHLTASGKVHRYSPETTLPSQLQTTISKKYAIHPKYFHQN